MSFVLRPHHSCRQSPFRIEAQVTSRGRMVEWTMEVLSPTGKEWHVDRRFGTDARKNWELWNFDVVETFLQPRQDVRDQSAPYLELQLSPLNQPLALMILKPRVSFYTPLQLDLRHDVTLGPGRWLSRVRIELPRELQTGPLYGGLFACLGQGPRSYLSLNPNPEERPDFHRPELFVKL